MRCFLSDASISGEPGTVSRGFFHAKSTLVQHRSAVPFTGRQNNAIVFLEFQRVFGGGSKILLLWRGCCFCPSAVSSGRWRRQQNPASVAWLLPLTFGGFIGSLAEAAKSCFCGVVAAFDLGEFHRVFGGGSKILLLRCGCCFWDW